MPKDGKNTKWDISTTKMSWLDLRSIDSIQNGGSYPFLLVKNVLVYF